MGIAVARDGAVHQHIAIRQIEAVQNPLGPPAPMAAIRAADRQWHFAFGERQRLAATRGLGELDHQRRQAQVVLRIDLKRDASLGADDRDVPARCRHPHHWRRVRHDDHGQEPGLTTGAGCWTNRHGRRSIGKPLTGEPVTLVGQLQRRQSGQFGHHAFCRCRDHQSHAAASHHDDLDRCRERFRRPLRVRGWHDLHGHTVDAWRARRRAGLKNRRPGPCTTTAPQRHDRRCPNANREGHGERLRHRHDSRDVESRHPRFGLPRDFFADADANRARCLVEFHCRDDEVVERIAVLDAGGRRDGRDAAVRAEHPDGHAKTSHAGGGETDGRRGTERHRRNCNGAGGGSGRGQRPQRRSKSQSRPCAVNCREDYGVRQREPPPPVQRHPQRSSSDAGHTRAPTSQAPAPTTIDGRPHRWPAHWLGRRWADVTTTATAPG